MSEDKPTDALVSGVKTAVVHFGKAAFEIAAGVGALWSGVTKTVRPDSDDEVGTGGHQSVPVE